MQSTTKITTVVIPEGVPCYLQPQGFNSIYKGLLIDMLAIAEKT